VAEFVSTITRKRKNVVTLVSPTRISPGVHLALNKMPLSPDEKLIISTSYSNVKIYAFTQAKEKAQYASITDHVSVTNPTLDRDFDDGTSASRSTAGYTIEDVRTYDFQTVKTRFVHVRTQGATATYVILLGSVDGNNWTTLLNVNPTSATSYFLKAEFRYLRWRNDNSRAGYSVTLHLYSIEVFDPDDYDYYAQKAYHEITGLAGRTWVVFETDQSLSYSVFRAEPTYSSYVEEEVIL